MGMGYCALCYPHFVGRGGDSLIMRGAGGWRNCVYWRNCVVGVLEVLAGCFIDVVRDNENPSVVVMFLTVGVWGPGRNSIVGWGVVDGLWLVGNDLVCV